MKFTGLRTFVFLIYALLKLDIVSSQTVFQKNSHRTYDVVQSLEELSENVRTAQYLGTTTNQFDISKVLDSIRSIDFDTFLNVVSNSSNSSCLQDLLYTAEKLKNTKLQDLVNDSWALQMIDSFGKPESGYLDGNTKWLGDFDECRSVYAPKQNSSNVGGFRGKYCSLQVILYILPATVGICLPETCNPSDFMRNDKIVLNSIPAIDKLKSIVTVSSLTCHANTRQLSGGAIATICIMSIFVFLAFLGSLITVIKYVMPVKSRKRPCQNIVNEEAAVADYDKAYEKAYGDTDDQLLFTEGSRTKLSVFIEKGESFLNCFCVFTNGSKLLNTDATEGQLLCLHGIRFLSMSWVIVCHTYMSPLGVIRNFKGVLNQVDNFPFQAILNGWYSVDSFFLLSGFLLAYLYFQECAKRDVSTGICSFKTLRDLFFAAMQWVYFYAHRYIRLTPVYMIVLAFYTTIYPYLGTGPFWSDYDVDPNCQKSWWWNLLYINNFQDSVNQCMGWSWYLANDMQFFVVSPLFLVTLWRLPKIGFPILAVALCGVWVAGFVITYHYELIAGGIGDVTKIASDQAFMIKWQDYFNKIYTKPYTRAGPYLVGIALGYIAHKRKITNYKLKNMELWIGWLIAAPVGIVCVYGLYHNFPAVLASSFFNALIRTCYALSLSWMIFVCLSGQGGPVDKILSYKLFIPLSRLTYSAYLIHLIIIMTYITSLKTTLVFTHSTMVILFLGLIIVTYALALPVSLIFESPIIRLEKFVRGKFRH